MGYLNGVSDCHWQCVGFVILCWEVSVGNGHEEILKWSLGACVSDCHWCCF